MPHTTYITILGGDSMSSVLLNEDGTNICPACIEYSGTHMDNIRARNNEKNDGSGHISMSYRIYRWF